MQSPITPQRGQTGKRTRTVDEVDNQDTSKQRKRSKRSRLSENGKEGFGQRVAGDAQGKGDSTSTSLVKTAESGQQNSNQSEALGWTLSRGGGGRFSDMDAIFTEDGQYILLGLETAVQVFSVSTSRLIRVLGTKRRQHVTSFKLSRSNPAHLYVSTHSGNITKWDWSSGDRIRSWETSNHIFDLALGSIEAGDSSMDVLLTLHDQGKGQRAISLSNPEPKSRPRHLDGKVILETASHIGAIQSARNGKVLVVRAGEKMLVGVTSQLAVEDFASVDYVWREITLPTFATCFDIREHTPYNSSSTTAQSSVVDVIVGESQGSLLIYNDILNTLYQIEQGREVDAKSGLISSRLHWHRNAVKTVRWSRDGNYIISGGVETVLVLWQLDTGRKQFLPHLSSQICNITVSPVGDSYAVKLADNSVMVLATSNLRPITSINGLQLSSTAGPRELRPVPDDVHRSIVGKSNRVPRFPPAILHPLNQSQLLLAASAQMTSVENAPSNNMLQTFDIGTYHQISRQALARTISTVINTTPDGLEVTTPDIRHIGITEDGKWLAAVDEWTPRPRHIEPLHVNKTESGTGFDSRREVFLKFWEWNEVAGEWELVTRTDAPHYKSSVGSTSVLDLAANPAGSEFATIGGDGVVRFWTCGSRYRRENTTRSSTEGRRLKSWRCRNTVSLEGSAVDVDPSGGCLSFSEDGSVLAVCWNSSPNNSRKMVYLIDPQTCDVRHAREGLCEGIPRSIGFLGRDLIVLSNRVVVWDTVDDKLELSTPLLETAADEPSDRHHPLLSINPRSNTFVVAYANHGNETTSFRVQVFSSQSFAPLFETSLKVIPHAIIADPLSGDHIIIDSAAQIRRLSSNQATSTVHPIADIPSVTSQFGNIFGNAATDSLAQNVRSQPVAGPDDDADDEKLSTKNLSRVFGTASGLTLPVISVLFEDMMGLLKK
ncbi:hypothetical protein FQN54_006874 [Arachnomyces sp. PD_36]|nr:hypothetical protein FQN54_006874 [Arachnomyces sp. PD_36]